MIHALCVQFIERKRNVVKLICLLSILNRDVAVALTFCPGSFRKLQPCTMNFLFADDNDNLPTISPVQSTKNSVKPDVSIGQIEISDPQCSLQPFAQHKNLTLTSQNNGTVLDLLDMNPGEFISTNAITVVGTDHQNYTFCINVFPFGTLNRRNNKKRSGFGMSYAVASTQLPDIWPINLLNNDPMEKFRRNNVKIYLQFLPQTTSQKVDASFAIRLLGQQQDNRFDIEWKAGMRFVHKDFCALEKGQSNDFGSSFMSSYLISSFWNGLDPVQLQLDIQLHTPPQFTKLNHNTEQKLTSIFPQRLLSPLRDIRQPDDCNDNDFAVVTERQKHNTEKVRVGRVVVPILSKLSQRPKMFEQGVYPGVEYRIMRMHKPSLTSNDSIDLFYSQPGVYYDLKPIYPLVRQLERTWPVTVDERDIPRLYSPNQYNLISAIGSLMTAFTGLLVAFIISQCISLYYIPSRSMEPTLAIGDVLLVEKVSSKFWNQYNVGDVVLFNPPSKLQEVVLQSGGSIDRRSLFVKRIAALPGDHVVTDPSGSVFISNPYSDQQKQFQKNRDICETEPVGLIRKYLPKTVQETVVPPNNVEVLGDCSFVSIDSRVWGPLPAGNIAGRPIVRIWPISKFGPIPDIPSSTLEVNLNNLIGR